MESQLNKVEGADGIKLGIVAPDGREAMLQHSRDFERLGIPHIFDPGQAMTLFDGDDLKTFIKQANWLVANDYEFQLIRERTGMSKEAVAAELEALVITQGGDGSLLITSAGEELIKPGKPTAILDPTGCGRLLAPPSVSGLGGSLRTAAGRGGGHPFFGGPDPRQGGDGIGMVSEPLVPPIL